MNARYSEYALPPSGQSVTPKSVGSAESDTPPAGITADATAARARDKQKPAMAVALHYSGRGAPRVTAKGGGVIAQNIIETARQHGVPLEEDAVLVGALSRVDLGREIPRELWVAVAQVLTFAWSVAGKKTSK